MGKRHMKIMKNKLSIYREKNHDIINFDWLMKTKCVMNHFDWLIKSNNLSTMRESDREIKRGDFSRHRHKQSHRRYSTPEERTHRGGRGPSGVPENGWDGDDWTVVRVRKRKAPGQVVRGQDRQRVFEQQGGSLAGQERWSRFRSSLRFDHNAEYGNLVNPRQHDGGKARFNHVDRTSVWERLEFPSITYQKQPEADQARNAGAASLHNADTSNFSEYQRYVTFYFTNMPDLVPYFVVKETFEVCGIMDNLFLSRKRNKQGRIYKFVRYVNVRDAEKLLKAVNNITIGQFRVWAKFARFGRKPLGVVEPRGSEGVRGKGVAKMIEEKREGSLEEGGIKVCEGENSKHGVKNKEGGGDIEQVREDVRLGKVKVKEVGGRGGAGTGASLRKLGMEELRQQVETKSFAVNGGKVVTKAIVPQPVCKMVRSYKSKLDDLLWARKGVIASVLNGQAIPVIQTRIADAGFDDIDIIPFGADKVYIQCVSNADVMTVIAEAQDFFNLFFTQPVR